MVHTCNLALKKKQVDHEFKTSLNWRRILKLVWAKWNPIWKQTKKQKNTK